ncbi:MAG: GxxExxY protein [Paludibacteraceae bacterium]|nr:GxxExxY protein [Paludibacteraceae bacterium]
MTNSLLPVPLLEEINKRLYPIFGCVYEVHKTLGRGLEEAIYSEALCIELTKAGVKNDAERNLPCYYKGQKLDKTYRMDIVCDEDIILELKSVEQLVAGHREQLFNYMRLTKMPIGVLINFNAAKVVPEKYYLDQQKNEVIRFY